MQCYTWSTTWQKTQLSQLITSECGILKLVQCTNLEIIRNDFLNEVHGCELLKLSDSDNVSKTIYWKPCKIPKSPKVQILNFRPLSNMRKRASYGNEAGAPSCEKPFYMREEEKMNLLHIFTYYVIEIVIIWFLDRMFIIVLSCNLSAIIVNRHVVFVGLRAVVG